MNKNTDQSESSRLGTGIFPRKVFLHVATFQGLAADCSAICQDRHQLRLNILSDTQGWMAMDKLPEVTMTLLEIRGLMKDVAYGTMQKMNLLHYMHSLGGNT